MPLDRVDMWYSIIVKDSEEREKYKAELLKIGASFFRSMFQGLINSLGRR